MGGLTFHGSTVKAGYHRLLQGGRKPTRTQDGWIAMLPYTTKHWHAFFNAVGHPELSQKYDIEDRQKRNAHVRELYALLRQHAPQKTTAEWMALCTQLDIPATPIYTPDELPEHPHLKAVGLFQDAEHPTEGPIRQIRPTTRFSATPANIYRPAPKIGQHTDEVLREAGLSAEDIARLREQKAIV
jgi:formyl-CoA transferase